MEWLQWFCCRSLPVKCLIFKNGNISHLQNYLDQSLRTLKPKVVVPIHWDNFFKPIDQPLEFLPYLADHTEQSLKILIQAAEQQHTRPVLLSQPVSYPLDPALQSAP
ncbi:hypothetical protein B9T38_01720 [Acinetobacter sp. ANC 4218]|nr:hypothetical protein B9T38_01720 [Acinetobacter sp. ANC 4218]